MTFELSPRTSQGKSVVAAAEKLIPVFAERAQAADASNEICRPNFDDLRTTGIAAAFVPEELGGMGLESIHDWIVAITTLARGDASTAIAITMQHGTSRGMASAYRGAKAKLGADHMTTEALATPLRALVNGEMVICATATEAGTDNLHPMTEATRDGDGWRINGKKIFVTMSPIASHIATVIRIRDDEGDTLAGVLLPIDTPGVIPQDDWDALGMRSSGSQSVAFEDVLVPIDAPRRIAPWGQWGVVNLESRATANTVLLGAFLGIAEAAHDIAVETLQSRSRVGQPVTERPGVQHVAGEMALELAQCRAVLGAVGTEMDAYVERHRESPASFEEAHHLMTDYQAAKWTVNRGAIGVVSKAMDLLSGSGYTNSHPLARLYRDVRAGPFMQPFGATELREYVGQVTLGHYPVR